MRTRTIIRAVAVTAPLATLTLATPALAVYPDAGDEPGPGLSAAETLLLFVGAPLVLFLLLALLAAAPSIVRGGYKPSLGWWSEPVWFGGPADPYTALDAVGTTAAGGGASARW